MLRLGKTGKNQGILSSRYSGRLVNQDNMNNKFDFQHIQIICKCFTSIKKVNDNSVMFYCFCNFCNYNNFSYNFDFFFRILVLLNDSIFDSIYGILKKNNFYFFITTAFEKIESIVITRTKSPYCCKHFLITKKKCLYSDKELFVQFGN